jgi:ribosomal protein S18 acetylase RimI-like enzyme
MTNDINHIVLCRPHELSDNYLSEIAKLHRTCMPDTLTSLRGVKTTMSLYKQLLLTGGEIHLLLKEQVIVGVVTISHNYRALASIKSLRLNIFSWVKVVSQVGFTQLFSMLRDSLNISNLIFSNGKNFLYISTLYVHHEHRGQGLASSLIEFVQSSALLEQRLILVDTRRANTSACALYDSKTFNRQGATNLSYLYKWDGKK